MAACPTFMDFKLTSHPGCTIQLIVLFCFLWPFATLTFLARRQTSPAPVLAVLLAVAVAECGMWIGLINTLVGLALSGSARLAASAGIAETLMVLPLVLFSTALIALFALIRRHRPSIDRVTAVLVVILIVEILAALIYAARITPSMAFYRLALVGLGTSVFMAVVIATWIVLVVRVRVRSHPIPFAVPVAVLLYAAVALLVNREAHRYMDIARHGYLSTWY